MAQHYTDRAVNAFKKTNNRDDPFVALQDPTKLGFKLLFDFNDIGLLNDNKNKKNTAMNYLYNIGDTNRMGYLASFIKLLKRINSEAPWYFQTIEGLTEARKHGFDNSDFRAGLSADRRISIACLDEAIDLRTTALMDLYRKACFDRQFRREVVPVNLRRFNISVYCYESSSINRYGKPILPTGIPQSRDASSINPDFIIPGDQTSLENKKTMDRYFGEQQFLNDTINAQVNTIDDNISRVLFNFNYCEFMSDEGGDFLSKVANNIMQMTANKIVFSYRNVNEMNIYRLFHNKSVQDYFVATLDSAAKDMAIAKIDTKPINTNGIVDTSLTQANFGKEFSQPNVQIPSPKKNQFSEELSAYKNTIVDLVQAEINNQIETAKTIYDQNFNKANNQKRLGNVYGLLAGEISIASIPPIANELINEIADNVRQTDQVKFIKEFTENIYGYTPAGGVDSLIKDTAVDLIDNAFNKNQAIIYNASLNNDSKPAKGMADLINSISLQNDAKLATGKVDLDSNSLQNDSKTATGVVDQTSNSLQNDTKHI